MPYQLRLVVRLKDGRTLSGTYPYLQALARDWWAQAQENYLSSELTEATE